MKKKLFAVILTAAMAMGLVACGGGAAAPAAPAAAPAASQEAAAPAASEAAPAEAASEAAPASERNLDLIWGGTSASSGYYALNVAVCDIINSYVDGVHVTLMETGGTVDDYKLMMAGEASFAQTSNVNEYCLQNDTGIYEGFGYTDSYDMCFFVPQAYRFVVTKDSGITSLSELQGKKYNAGLSGSSSEMESMNILGAIGVEPDWFPASTADAIDAISNRQCIGLTKSGTYLSTDSTLTNLQSSVDLQFLSFTDEEVAKVQEQYPYYGFETVDCSMYGEGYDYETQTYCSRLGFSAAKDLPEDVVYDIVKAIDEHLDEIRAAYPGIVEDPIAFTVDENSISKIHPGVVKYAEERGLTVPENRK